MFIYQRVTIIIPSLTIINHGNHPGINHHYTTKILSVYKGPAAEPSPPPWPGDQRWANPRCRPRVQAPIFNGQSMSMFERGSDGIYMWIYNYKVLSLIILYIYKLIYYIYNYTFFNIYIYIILVIIGYPMIVSGGCCWFHIIPIYHDMRDPISSGLIS